MSVDLSMCGRYLLLFVEDHVLEAKAKPILKRIQSTADGVAHNEDVIENHPTNKPLM
jgi:hypothetical protein